MLTSKSKIAEQVLRKLRKYSIDADFDEREIMISAHQVLSALIRNRFYETRNTESQEVSGTLYYSITDIEVKKNDADQYYIDAPSSTVELPFGIEIKRVGTKKGKGFIPVQLGFDDLYGGLSSGCLEGQVGYAKSGTTIVFSNMEYKNAPKTVDLSMVLPFDELDEDDEINIPKDMEGMAVSTLVQEYRAVLELPVDEVPNSNDNN